MIFKVNYYDKYNDKYLYEDVEISTLEDLEILQNRYQLLENQTYGDDAWEISLIVHFKEKEITIYNYYVE